MRTWGVRIREEARRQPINHRARRSVRLALVERGHYGTGVFRASLALLADMQGQYVGREREWRGLRIVLCEIECCKDPRL